MLSEIKRAQRPHNHPSKLLLTEVQSKRLVVEGRVEQGETGPQAQGVSQAGKAGSGVLLCRVPKTSATTACVSKQLAEHF